MLKEILPPIVVRFLTGLWYGWSGNYSTWQEAQKKCPGYNSDIIFNKVKNALLKVKTGEAIFERDSVLFEKVHYSFPLLSALTQVALTNKSTLNVLDFGGSLGSSYFQNRSFFRNINEFKWNIVEQEHFVTEGQKTFSDAHLNFYYTINECLKEQKVNVILLGSVLQYIENPYQLLEELISQKVDYIIIDRTPVYINRTERITIQKVPKKIYEAQYPCWILEETKLLNNITNKGYELVFDSESSERMNLKHAHLKGYFFKFKK